MTDDECIAIAMLHGAEMVCDDAGSVWVLNDWNANSHPIEKAEHIRRAQSGGSGGDWFLSRAALARAYCEYYKLMEPSHEPT
jgi:hypothetical protein